MWQKWSHRLDSSVATSKAGTAGNEHGVHVGAPDERPHMFPHRRFIVPEQRVASHPVASRLNQPAHERT